MLTPPDGFSEDLLVSELARGWGVAAVSVAYQAVGFGSHHWEVAGADGVRWFVTVDELEARRRCLTEPLAVAFDRLRASLSAARDLLDRGYAFVVAPVPAGDGEPLVRADDRFGVALYPFVDGQSFEWGEFAAPAHRHGVLGLIVAIHTAPDEVWRHAAADDFAIPHRDELESALAFAAASDRGPYARPAALLIRQHAVPIQRLLDHYDGLVAAGRSGSSRAVLTHGEPHPGNTMLASGGWLLIDWDTALLAPPERDLWGLDPGDGSVLDAYADATGMQPLPSVLELYRIRWDLADIAVDVSRFRAPHSGSRDDDMSWDLLNSLVTRVGG